MPGTPGSITSVRWLGGPPDSGKTTLARSLADLVGASVYSYDEADLRHHQALAKRNRDYAAFLAMDMDARWVEPTPERLADRSWRAIQDRFPLVLGDLAQIEGPVIAEGFGLTPALVAPLLSDAAHAVWLEPESSFCAASRERRRKGQFGGEVSDPKRAGANLSGRDEILAFRLAEEARLLGVTVVRVDGSASPETLARELVAKFGW